MPCARLIAVERRLARLLRNGGSAGGDGLLQARCDGGERLRADEPAEPPSRHGVSFGKARNHENPIRRTDARPPETCSPSKMMSS